MNGLQNDSESLVGRKCVPCEADDVPMTGEEISRFMEELGHGWEVVGDHHIEKKFKFQNFREALEFTNKVGELAEFEGHHPDIYLAWGKVKVMIWTHKIAGLHENDFILASKIERIL